MMKVNDIYIEKLENDQYKVKEWNKEKEMFYVANYTKDEIEINFNIKKEDYNSSLFILKNISNSSAV